MKTTFFLVSLLALAVFSHEESPYHLLRPFLEKDLSEFQDHKISISAWKEFKKDRDLIGFEINGVENPSEGDLVLLYSPASADPSKVSPVTFYNGTELGKEYLKSGRVVSSFFTFPTGQDFIIRFFKDQNIEGQKVMTKALASNLIEFAEFKLPSQLHISVGESKEEINVMWTTFNSTVPQVLRFGREKGNPTTTIQATFDSYTIKDMCGSPANEDWGWANPGTLWNATIRGLPASTKTYYSVGSSQTGFTKERHFQTPPKASQTKPLVFLAIGDLGVFSPQSSESTVDNMKNETHTDLVIHVGDISYARGIATQWPKFMREIEPIASTVPWMTLPGNHERDWPGTGTIGGKDSGGECGIAFEKRFKMPTTTHAKPWYSFEFGPVHFSFISTEVPFETKSPQWNWLVQDLSKVNRSHTPWLVVAGHRPMYINSDNFKPSGDQPVAQDLRKHVEPLLKKFKVDVGFWGHHHSYQRTCAAFNNKCEKGATVHFAVGNAGAGLSKNIVRPYPEVYKYVDDDHWGHSRVTVDHSTFKLEYLPNGKGKVADSFELKK